LTAPTGALKLSFVSFSAKGKQEKAATDSGMLATATFVVASASGAAAPVPEPLKPAEIEALKNKTSSAVLSNVARARVRSGVVKV
jgi:hypothetical protein